MTDQSAAPAAPVDPAAPCACNSGLTAGRCCALDSKAAPPAEVDAEPDAAELAAAEALRAGDSDHAARLAIDVLEGAPLRVAGRDRRAGAVRVAPQVG